MGLMGEGELSDALAKLPGWRLEGKTLIKTFDQRSFRAAIALVNTVADLAERVDHHPDMLVEYKNVTFRLWTHSAGGVTEKDVALARQIETVSAPEPP